MNGPPCGPFFLVSRVQKNIALRGYTLRCPATLEIADITGRDFLLFDNTNNKMSKQSYRHVRT